MQRHHDRFVSKLNEEMQLFNKRVLEISHDDTAHTLELARWSQSVMAISPDYEKIKLLRKRPHKRVRFAFGSPEALAFPDSTFDVVIFNNFLYRVLWHEMYFAISEALRVVGNTGRIVFLEPGTIGSLYDAEREFGGNGIEQLVRKGDAAEAIRTHPALQIQKQYTDTTKISFVTTGDFLETMRPAGSVDKDRLHVFLTQSDFVLYGDRQITICKPR